MHARVRGCACVHVDVCMRVLRCACARTRVFVEVYAHGGMCRGVALKIARKGVYFQVRAWWGGGEEQVVHLCVCVRACVWRCGVWQCV